MRRIIFQTTDEGGAKIEAAAAAKGLTLTEYICKRLGVKPLPMGRPKASRAPIDPQEAPTAN